jgi:hypothetical protein
VFHCCGAQVRKDIGRDELQHDDDADRNEDQVVEIAEDRDEVGYQVDRRQCIGRDRARRQLRIPGHTAVTRRQPQDDDVSLDAPCPSACPFQPLHV